MQETQDTTEVQPEQFNMDSFMAEFAKIQRQLLLNNPNNKTVSRPTLVDYSKLKTYLDNPVTYKKDLINLSRDAETSNLMYSRVLDHNTYMSLDKFVIIPTQVDKFNKTTNIQKQYNQCIKYVDSMKLEYNMPRFRKSMLRDGYFFGIVYENESQNDFFIQELEPQYCEISSWQQGFYNFTFDFSYFDQNEEKVDVFEAIVPKFFKSGHARYKKDRQKYQWQEVPTEHCVCFPLSDKLPSTPYFASSMFSLNEIEDYKDLQKAKTENDNYKLLAFKFGTFNDKSNKPDNFQLRPTTVQQFFAMARQGVNNDKIGMIVSPFDMESISFSDNSANANYNNVANATHDFYNEVGVSQLLFNAENSTALKFSIKNSESLVFYMNRKIECWINRHLARKFKNMFKIKILDATVYNHDDLISRYTQLATLGVPVKTMLASLAGETPLELQGLTFLESDAFLDINNNWKPLATSHTLSSDSDSGGRPEQDVLSESGEQTKESGANENRAEV